ncbi:MAG: hypothetical protein M3502_00095 [Actinomycetota bacterium]|nr:hypothetical protein [Actinomycetota bacterium]
MQAELPMPLGEQGAQDAGAGADLAEVGSRSREQVSDLTLLGQAAGHQHTADAPQESARQEERVEDRAGRVPWLNGGVLFGHAVRTVALLALGRGSSRPQVVVLLSLRAFAPTPR